MAENVYTSSNYVIIEKNKSELLKTVILNIIKMIANRGYLSNDKVVDIYKKTISASPDDMVYKIPINYKKFKEFVFKIIPQSISTINKASGISDFLLNYKNTLTLVVVDDVSRKAREDAYRRFPNTQLFLKSELLTDKLDNNLVPKHVLLTKEQTEQFFIDYNIKKKHMPKINYNDPIAKYYNAKPGDVFKIIRPSETTIYANSYRLVIKKEHIVK